jgi:hypothetical protein
VSLPLPPTYKGEAPLYDWHGRNYTAEYEWIIQHPDKDLFFVRWEGVFKKKPVWTDYWREATRFKAESNFMHEGPGTRAMRLFREVYPSCSCLWARPRFINLELLD